MFCAVPCHAEASPELILSCPMRSECNLFYSIPMRICVCTLFLLRLALWWRLVILLGVMRICGKKVLSNVLWMFRFVTSFRLLLVLLHNHNSAQRGCRLVATMERLENQ